MDLSADRRIRRLTVPILRRFAALRWRRAPQLQARTIATLAERATELLARGQMPMFSGYHPRPGLLADAPDEALRADAKSPQWAAALKACARAEMQGVPADSPESPADALKLLAGDAVGQFERGPQVAGLLAG